MSSRERKPPNYDRVRDAWDALAKQPRPDGVSGVTWLSVLAVLHRLARYAKYDVIRPTQEKLASDLDVSRDVVKTRLEVAERLGMIKRSHQLLGGRWAFTTYELLFLHGGLSTTDHGGSPTTDHGGLSTTNTPPKKEEEKTEHFVLKERQGSTSGRTAPREEPQPVTPGEKNADEILLAFGERHPNG